VTRMEKWLLWIVVAGIVAAGVPAAGQRRMSPLKELKVQQKIERKQLKFQRKAWKRSYHGRQIPRAVRLSTKHQYQIEMRDLKTRQKDELERMKDQLRIAKAEQKHQVM
jgi:hypothetical protein